jgi:NAD(P)-dependent dehydrogenase (short-subunit alcohol dehydrogenase family)
MHGFLEIPPILRPHITPTGTPLIKTPPPPFSPKMSFFKGKVLVVTGGGSGIGRATSQLLLEDGAKVYIADLNISGAESLASKYGEKCVVVKTDVSSLQSVKDLFTKVAESGDTLWGAVNAAGVNLPGVRLHETTDEFYNKTKGVNLDGVFYSLREELKILSEQGKGGAIVNLSSGAGLVGMRNAATYCGTKHAVAGLTKAAAIEYAPENIRINAVAPGISRIYARLTSGPIETPLFRGVIPTEEILKHVLTTVPLGRVGQPVEVANFITYLLSDKASYITGNVSLIDGAWLAGTG